MPIFKTATAGSYTHPDHLGEVSSVADGVQTITTATVTNAKLANMATKTYKGRTSAATGVPEDVAVATVKTDLALVKADVGLGSVDNTADTAKPVSTAQQTALDLKEASANKGAVSGYAPLDAAQKVPTVNLGGAGADNTKYLRGDQSWVTPAGGSEAFPVGSVFISVVSTNPATLLGYGTWSAFGAGRVLVGLNASDADFDTVEEEGGAKTVTLTTAQIPAHDHIQNRGTPATGNFNTSAVTDTSSGGTGATAGKAETDISTSNAGGGEAHNNVQPYIVVYMWKRTA